MKRLFVFLATLAVLTALIASPASAEGGPVSRSFIGDDALFKGEDSVDLNDGAADRLRDVIRRAQQAHPGSQCPIDVDLTVRAASTVAGALLPDPLFSTALAQARSDKIVPILEGIGPTVRINPKAEVGLVSMVTISAQSAVDKEPPNLRTNSTPPKGSKVQPRQQIVVTMTARDDANRWQSGIKTVTLVADSEGDRLIAGPTYAREPAGCTDAPREREVRATYEVPPDPPPIVRLTATAMDHVNLTDKDVGEFPTGEWYGTITWTNVVANSRGRATTTANADLALNPDGSGGLTGRLVGSHTVVAQHGCSSRTATAATIQADLVGSYTPGRDAMAIRATDKQTTPMQIEVLCPGAPPRVTSQHADYYEFYQRALRGLRPTADGGFSSSDDQERPCEGGTCTTRISLTLRRVRN
jgi:hypothetical protein